MTRDDDPLIAEWAAVLRDPDSRQAFGAYTDPYDMSARCAWGHNPHQNKVARRYGQRFRIDVEKLNDKYHWPLPDIADYVEDRMR